jgi:hypothetical protein
MSRTVIVILIHHRNKPVDLSYSGNSYTTLQLYFTLQYWNVSFISCFSHASHFLFIPFCMLSLGTNTDHEAPYYIIFSSLLLVNKQLKSELFI